MDTLPNRDTVAAFEARLGKPLMTVLIWLLAIALAFGALGVIVAGIRAAYGFFYPMLPASGWVTAAERVAAAFAIGFLLVFSKYVAAALQKLRSIERVDTNTQAVAEVVAAESQRTADLIERFKRLEERFDYMENKVGSELRDIITSRMLEAQGITVDDLGRVKQLPVPHPITDKQRGRLDHARKLLRESAATRRAPKLRAAISTRPRIRRG